jgi:hypothetical protein
MIEAADTVVARLTAVSGAAHDAQSSPLPPRVVRPSRPSFFASGATPPPAALESASGVAVPAGKSSCPGVDDLYEGVRSNDRGGLAAFGHEDRSIEHVIAQNDRFVTTEKFGEAGDVHAETNPRG